MDACCETKAEELCALRDEHKKLLIIVLVINAVLFIVEAAAGLIVILWGCPPMTRDARRCVCDGSACMCCGVV